MAKKFEGQWRVNTPAFLREIMSNPHLSVMQTPMRIFAHILGEVATRASELNDPELNALMCRLALYEISDPYSKEYDEELTKKIMRQGRRKSNA